MEAKKRRGAELITYPADFSGGRRWRSQRSLAFWKRAWGVCFSYSAHWATEGSDGWLHKTNSISHFCFLESRFHRCFSPCGWRNASVERGTDVEAFLSQHSLGSMRTGLNTRMEEGEGRGRAVCCPKGHVLGVKWCISNALFGLIWGREFTSFACNWVIFLWNVFRNKAEGGKRSELHVKHRESHKNVRRISYLWAN